MAFASLHTSSPTSQNEYEVNYKGYHRIPVEYGENFGDESLVLQFPAIEESVDGEIIYVSIGSAEVGDGEVFLVIHSMPCIKMQKTVGDNVPTICITKEPSLPSHLNPIAAVAYKLWLNQSLLPEALPPKLYEAINDALSEAGLPVIPVVRTGSASWDVDMKNLSLSGWN